MIPRPLSRREFLKQIMGTLAITPTLSISTSGTEDLKLEEISVPIPRLPENFEGLKIGFLSDIHLSTFLPPHLLENALAILSKQEPDLVLLGGDYIWHAKELLRSTFPIERHQYTDLSDSDLAHAIYQDLVDTVSQSISPPLGIHAVMGNHDHWLEPATCRRIFAQSPIKMLVNQVSLCPWQGASIEIYGCDDYLTGIPRILRESLSNTDKTLRILLTHNPDILPWYFENSTLGFSLALMGHTHGGQICPAPGVAFTYNIQNRTYGEGLNTHPSGCQCYTSRGLGMVGIPLRLNCPSEVTLLTLRRVNV